MSEAETMLSTSAWSAETDKILPALIRAQSEIPPMVKDRESEVQTKRGASYKVKYLELSTLVETVTPVLNKHGLLHTCPGAEEDGARSHVVVEIIHESGQWYRGRLGIPHPPGEWEVGSMLTFFRRYLMLAMLGIQPAGEDDMGQAARKGREQHRRHETQRQTASATEKAARDRREAEYKDAVKAAAKGDPDWKAAAKTANGFASGAFGAEPAELTGPQWSALLAHLGGTLDAEWIANNVLLTAADRAKLGEYLGIETELSEEDRRLAELEEWAGPDVTVEEARRWSRSILEEDPLEMTGHRLATVRLWLKVSGHAVVEDAIGTLGEGDMTAGVSRLWQELGDPGIALENGPETLVDQLQQIAKEAS